MSACCCLMCAYLSSSFLGTSRLAFPCLFVSYKYLTLHDRFCSHLPATLSFKYSICRLSLLAGEASSPVIYSENVDLFTLTEISAYFIFCYYVYLSCPRIFSFFLMSHFRFSVSPLLNRCGTSIRQPYHHCHAAVAPP